MKKSLIAIIALLVAAQTQAVTYPIRIHNKTDKDLTVNLYPTRAPGCKRVKLNVRAQDNKEVHLPYRCCLRSIAARESGRTIAYSELTFPCPHKPVPFKIYKGPDGKIRIMGHENTTKIIIPQTK